jgi:hypothetical protein
MSEGLQSCDSCKQELDVLVVGKLQGVLMHKECYQELNPVMDDLRTYEDGLS